MNEKLKGVLMLTINIAVSLILYKLQMPLYVWVVTFIVLFFINRKVLQNSKIAN